MSRRTPDQLGFTLVEIMVAFTILVLSLGALLPYFGQGFRSAVGSIEYTEATLFCQGLLARAGVEYPLKPGVREGEELDGLNWRVVVEPFGPDEDLQKRDGVGLYKVLAEVTWGAEPGSPPRRVSLTSLRLGSAVEGG